MRTPSTSRRPRPVCSSDKSDPNQRFEGNERYVVSNIARETLPVLVDNVLVGIGRGRGAREWRLWQARRRIPHGARPGREWGAGAADRTAGGGPPFRRVREMKLAAKAFALAALLTAALVMTTAAAAVVDAPALADVVVEGGGGNQDPVPDYVLEKDGTVLIDGDLATDCRSFVGGPVPRADGDPDFGQARRVAEQCEEAGLPPSESTTQSASASAPAPSGTSTADGAEDRGLPETGGPALPASPVVAMVVVAASGLLARKVGRSPTQ